VVSWNIDFCGASGEPHSLTDEVSRRQFCCGALWSLMAHRVISWQRNIRSLLGVKSSYQLVDKYINTHRTVLTRGDAAQRALWISSTTGQKMTAKNLGTLISKLTRETIGVYVSPHLFRTAAASTAAVYGGKLPHLASALLGHRGARVTEEHYNDAMGFETGDAKVTNKDEVLKHMGEYQAQHYNIAKLLIGAHAFGVTTCVTIFKDTAKVLKIGSVARAQWRRENAITFRPGFAMADEPLGDAPLRCQLFLKTLPTAFAGKSSSSRCHSRKFSSPGLIGLIIRAPRPVLRGRKG
jgi:hypothetical protein